MRQMDPSDAPAKSPAPVGDLVCDSCGAFDAYSFGDQHYCLQCYTDRGACCADTGCKVERLP